MFDALYIVLEREKTRARVRARGKWSVSSSNSLNPLTHSREDLVASERGQERNLRLLNRQTR